MSQSQQYLLGLDIGTSGVKGILITPTGDIRATAFAGYGLSTPKPNWVEQNPPEWWNATIDVIKNLLAHPEIYPSEIAGVGLSGQMHSLVLIGKDAEVLRPAILWSDTRTERECLEINESFGLEALRKSVANPAIEGFTLPKLLWVRRNEPLIYEKIRRILLPKDYVRFMLTGEIATEVSDASGTLLYDVWKRKWSSEIATKFSVSLECLPPVYESHEVCGQISKQVSNMTGLPAGIPVVGGGADNTCGAIGTGVIAEGQGMASIGTSGVVLAPMNNINVDSEMRAHTFCHSIPNRWYVMGVMLMAGGALRWYKETFGEPEIEKARSMNLDVYDVITEEAKLISPGCEGLFFQPYLNGERTPHRSASARAAFIGATIRHSKNHFSRAVLEGITFGMRDSLEIIRKLGIDLRQIRLTGGGAKNAFWRQLQADIYGTDVAIVNSTEGPAFGAALLAGVGSHTYKDTSEAVNQTIHISAQIQPDLSVTKQYDEYYMIYSKIFPNLQDSYSKIHRTFSI